MIGVQNVLGGGGGCVGWFGWVYMSCDFITSLNNCLFGRVDKKSNRIAIVAMRRRCDDMVYMVVSELKEADTAQSFGGSVSFV